MARGQAISVQGLAQKTLAAVVDHYTMAGAGSTLPERRAVVAGDPRGIAWDCEQLTVTLAGVGWGPAVDTTVLSPQTAAQTSVMALRHVVLAVTLVRCTPAPGRDGQPPSIQALEAAGLQFMRDAGLLSQALVELCSKLKDGLPREARAQPGIVDPVGPEGGFHGLETSLAITAGALE